MHFNPRSREGSDAYPPERRPRHSDFNPRSREGSDLRLTATRRRSSQFQSTLPRRERRADGYERLDVRGHISIHAPAKGATAAFSEFPRCSADFNPRSREGSDILTARKDEHCFHFNPRSREGSDSRYNLRHPVPRHFNPRSREGSDPCGGIPVCIVAISIHAPVKRATCRDYSANVHNTISIHAPVKGATATIRIMIIGSLFQSTLP